MRSSAAIQTVHRTTNEYREAVAHVPDMDLIGKSPLLEEVRSSIRVVADSDTCVLITGESGTGKDVVANLIHTKSRRSPNPFVAVNCAALPKDVIENELFGHEQGAFTGALIKKKGCFEMANGGTLFLDELAETDPDTQAKLLRAIEHKSFRRLGGREEIRVDVRAIAATNKDIPAALETGALREDLFYRLSVFEILLPPLRDRKEDIPLLAQHFLDTLSVKHRKPVLGFSAEAMQMLIAFDWPGNIRELKNVVERAILMCPGEIIGPQFLSPRINGQKPNNLIIAIPFGATLWEAERHIIVQTLAATENNKSRAARILGISRRGLQKMLRKFNLTDEGLSNDPTELLSQHELSCFRKASRVQSIEVDAARKATGIPQSTVRSGRNIAME